MREFQRYGAFNADEVYGADAERTAEERCAELRRRLNAALTAVRADMTNVEKMSALRKLAADCVGWSKIGPNKFATFGGALESEAQRIQTEFGFTSEKK